MIIPPEITPQRVIDVMQILIDETTADIDRYEGTPFTGRNVAAQLGEIRAAQVALAAAVQHVARLLPPPAEVEG